MTEQQTVIKNEIKLQKPKMYAVIIYNDEITTMDFVVQILNKIFNKSLIEATELMLEIHENGRGMAGIYTWDIAMTKKNQVDIMKIEDNFPLKVSVEEYTICI